MELPPRSPPFTPTLREVMGLVSYAQEGLRAAQFPIEGYDELTVEEVAGRLGGLSGEELRVVRDYEERNKNRDTILEQLDRRIRGGS
jgi:hypothetical protein